MTVETVHNISTVVNATRQKCYRGVVEGHGEKEEGKEAQERKEGNKKNYKLLVSI